MTVEELVEIYMTNMWPHYKPGSLEYAIYSGIYLDGYYKSTGEDT